MALKVGDAAPAFEAPDQDGRNHTLDQYKGQWLLLYFYPKDDTPGCTKEACGFRDVFPKTEGKMVILGVSSDSQESHQKFIKKYDLPFTLLSDSSQKLREAYGASLLGFGKRVSFLIDPSGTIAEIYTGIDCVKHAEQVLEDRLRMEK